MTAIINIEGKTYEIRPVNPREKRRLILSLVSYVEEQCCMSCEQCCMPRSEDEMLRRTTAFKNVFAHVFPDATPLREVFCTFPQFTERKYVLSDAQPEHIAWAKAAEACRLIDSFLGDYGE